MQEETAWIQITRINRWNLLKTRQTTGMIVNYGKHCLSPTVPHLRRQMPAPLASAPAGLSAIHVQASAGLFFNAFCGSCKKNAKFALHVFRRSLRTLWEVSKRRNSSSIKTSSVPSEPAVIWMMDGSLLRCNQCLKFKTVGCMW